MGNVTGRPEPPDSGAPDDGTPRARGPADAIKAATGAYLRGEALDMSALASELGIGRATLYRWVGNREDLLAAVLTEATERTFRTAMKDAQGYGVSLVLDSIRRFMNTVIRTEALKILTHREPLVFIRLVTMPGSIEGRGAQMVAELLEQESAAGRVRLILPAPVMAQAIIRICDSHLYAPLLGRTEPDLETALQLVGLLLNASQASPAAAVGE